MLIIIYIFTVLLNFSKSSHMFYISELKPVFTAWYSSARLDLTQLSFYQQILFSMSFSAADITPQVGFLAECHAEGGVSLEGFLSGSLLQENP